MQIANSVVIGTYQSYTWQILVYDPKGHLIDGGTFNTIDAPYTPESQISDIQAVCSDNLHACPTLEILSGSTVISSPQPTPTAVVGERQSVTMKQVPNSGKAGPYTLASPAWSPPPKAIKNYTLALQTIAPTPVMLTTAELQKASLNFYMTDPTQSTNLIATAVLTSTTETAIVTASTAYNLNAPPMSWTSSSNPVRVGAYPFPVPTGTPEMEEALSLGQPVSNEVGIAWTVQAPATPTPLPGVSGVINVTQTISSSYITVPNGCQTTFPTSGVELDNFLFYANHSPVSLTSSWLDSDSPAVQLAGQPPSPPPTCSSLTRTDAFVDYLMFKSSKSNSIWTPIMRLTWNWQGRAVFAAPQGWSLGSGPVEAGTPTGSPNYSFPQWQGVFSNNQ
ncbi:MAG: hypothetical protein JOY86_05885 [Candidatus Eremiobacteraeota bacterium]|nr:hypothetical protein [Candidatus Eremiobacteraeota bacterium]